MPENFDSSTPARKYFANAKAHEQLALIEFRNLEPPNYILQPSADVHYFPYLQRYLTNVVNHSSLPEGEVIASVHDAIWSKEDDFPKLCFGRAVGDESCILLPDPFYIKAEGYAEDYVFLNRHEVAWENKKKIAYFRGASTGGHLTFDLWKTNRRVRLAELSLANPKDIDAKITIIVQEDDVGIGEELKKANLIAPFEPPETCIQYRYVIDIDGNANSWGYYLKLSMGSLVFKVESIWEQWFYNWIKPWVHYVPVKADLSDLVEKVEWARNNDEEAQRIALQGKEFARTFTYARAMDYGVDVISRAIRSTNTLKSQNLS